MSWIEKFVEMLFPLDASSLNIEGAFLLKYENLPSSIFKYRDVNENSLKNLRDDTVWLADPRTLNDPYDCGHFIDFDLLTTELLKEMPQQILDRLPQEKAANIIQHVKESHDPQNALFDKILSDESPEKAQKIKHALLEATKAMFEDMGSSGSEGFKSAFKLCSFSARVDSTLMWAHYANYHKGFCIEYDIKNAPFTNHLSRFLYPVIYSNKPFDATPNTRRAGDKNFNNLYMNQAGLIKAMDWSYEKEWRLMFSNGIIKTAQPYNMPRPKSVYLGSHIEKDDQTILVDICRSKGIPVKKMKHSRAVFEMQALPIEESDRKFFAKHPWNT